LCPDCWDYSAAVVWNAHAPELWRRTTIALRRRLARHSRVQGLGRIQLSYVKVAEFQARGLVHFHAIFRLDALDVSGKLTPSLISAGELAGMIRAVAASMRFTTAPHPDRPKGWDITWGRQLDVRIIQVSDAAANRNVAVASYLAKYATKSTEAVGTVSCRITAANVSYYGNQPSHQGRLTRAAWRAGGQHPDFQAVRRWAHMLGYRGHFATKSRRYSTTLRALRTARADFRRHSPTAYGRREQAVITVSYFKWAGRGWRTSGDALLAVSAAARALDHRRANRDAALAA
jgi:hypothetical protein